VNVAIVGCGTISRHYAENAAAFDGFRLAACSDVLPESAEELAAAHGLRAVALDELLADPSVEVVLNLTPSTEHPAVTRAALEAGKHVYTEKPLALDVAQGSALLQESDARGLRVGCAPDIFLGGAYQAARALIDGGAIGEPLAVNAAMLVGGADSWHPSPEQFFQDGAGPLLDMGPYYLTAIVALLGPIRRVAAFGSIRKPGRQVMVGPRAGARFEVTTPTHTAVTMELGGGAVANLVASFEANGRYVADFVVHGTEGDLLLPDPNQFGGAVRVRRGRGDWEDAPYASRGPREARGMGLEELAAAIAGRREPLASGRLGLHVVDAARCALQAAAESRSVSLTTHVDRPGALPVAPA
jgi:predicted dehydrogenase